MLKKVYISLLVMLLVVSGSLSSQNNIVVRQDGKIILENEYIKLVFADGEHFQVQSISSKKENKSWLPHYGDIAQLWNLTLKGPDGINPALTPMHGVYKGAAIVENSSSKVTVAFTWKMRLSKTHFFPVRATVTLAKTSGVSEWNLEVDLPAGWVVTKTDFPRITIERENSTPTKIIMPAGWGVEYDLQGGYQLAAHYPSCTGSVQLMCIHKPRGEAFYYATHDKDACIKTFSASESGVFTSISTQVVASEAWTPKEGGTFKMPFSFSIGIEPDGWETAVTNWYRPFTFETEWGRKSFQSRNLPQWALNADMWLRPHFTTPETLEWLKKGLDFFGPEAACHWYRWHEIEYDVDYPEYFPPKKDFVPQMQITQKKGSHVVPYINGRLWDPQSISYKQQNGAAQSCRKEDGTLYTEIYGSQVPNSVTCPSSKVWQDIVKGLAARIQQELKADGVYIDQIGAAQGVPCWNPDHDHPLGGGEFWHSSYRKMLTDIRTELKPGNILITEENAECFMDLFDIMLMVNTPQSEYLKVVPLFPLIYSDRMMLNCFIYYPLTEKVNTMTFRFKNVKGLLWGTQLGWIKPELIMAPEAKEEAEFLRELVNFRKQQHDLIYGGRFIKEVIPEGDNPILSIPDMGNSPAVCGAYWVGSNGNKAVLLVNMDNVDHAIVLEDGKEIKMKGKECRRIDIYE